MPSDRSWMYEPPVQVPTIIQHYDGLPAITLSKLGDGSARLLWVFDEDYPQQDGLFLHLTDDEAQRVFETDPMVGLLESVRGDLHETEVLLWHSDQATMSAKFLHLPRSGTEDDLWEFIWNAVEGDYPFHVDARSPSSSGSAKPENPASVAAATRSMTLSAVAA